MAQSEANEYDAACSDQRRAHLIWAQVAAPGRNRARWAQPSALAVNGSALAVNGSALAVNGSALGINGARWAQRERAGLQPSARSAAVTR